jgi:hypothetical protein
VAEVLKQRNFSAFDLSKLQAGLYDMKLARGTDEYLARFVGWESGTAEKHEDIALFALRTHQGEEMCKLVLPDGKIDDLRRLKLLFALVFSARPSEGGEWVASAEELEMVK